MALDPITALLVKASKMPVTPRIFLAFAAIGMLSGLLVGYITMGTLHAVRLLPLRESSDFGLSATWLRHPYARVS
jgi:hypothetical protein